jgi:Arc/MetJ-type ribon-helix-helix transcriptional regulator
VCDMVLGMATTKVTVTVGDDQLRDIGAQVAAGLAPSVSGFVKHAIRIALFDAAGWREMLSDALKETGGPITEGERTWADSVLSPRPPRKRARKRRAA